MDDLISRQTAQTELMMKCERYTLARESHGMGHVEWSSDLISVADAMDAISDLPSAQSGIIRCKDCKHRDPEDKKCDCGHDILWQLPRDDNWFCADAERRTDERPD